APGDTTPTIRAGFSRATLSSTWRTIGQPASGCGTFGTADFMRVPAPAASTTTAIGDFMAVRMPSGTPSRKLDVMRGECAKECCMHPNADNLIANRFDTVIYDLDGTLIDSAKDMQVAVSRVLADHGLPAVTEDDVRLFMGQGSKVTMNKAFSKYGRQLDDAALSAVTREFVRYYEADPVSHTSAFSGVPQVVARFARLGLKQGVCTNKFERPSRMILEHLKLM